MNNKEKDTLKTLDELRVTEWLTPESACGKTCFKNCHTNRGWLINEIERLKRKGVHAVIVTHNGMMAIFRPRVGEKATDIESKLNELEAESESKK